MDNRKPRKIRSAQRQRVSMKLVIAAGVSIALLTIVFVIYFQFFRNEVTKAKNTETLTMDQLPAEFHVSEKLIQAADTLQRNGNRYKIAQPLSKTPAVPVQ